MRCRLGIVTDYIPSIDESHRFPAVVRVRLAGELSDPASEMGAALADILEELPSGSDPVTSASVASVITAAGEARNAVDTRAQIKVDAAASAYDTPALRNAAITGAIDAEVAARNSAVSTAIDAEVTARNAAVSAAIGTEVTARNAAVSAAISTEVTARNAAISASAATKADLVGGLVPTSQIPAVALTTGQAVTSRAAMLALTNVQEGDIVAISVGADKGTYLLGSGAASTFGSWLLLSTPTDVVLSVNGQNGTVVLGYADVGADASGAAAAEQTRAEAVEALKAPLASPAFTGTPTGISKTHVGLGLVDNTADSSKPISSAQQAALDAKAPLANPAFTGAPTGISKAHVGLPNVDNTADSAKPVSIAQQAAIDATGLVVSNVQTASYTLVLGDAGKAVEMNVGTANTLTVPPNSAVAFPVGTVIEVFQLGAGQVTVTAGAGVTLRAALGAKLAAQYASATLRKRATDEWVVAGYTVA